MRFGPCLLNFGLRLPSWMVREWEGFLDDYLALLLVSGFYSLFAMVVCSVEVWIGWEQCGRGQGWVEEQKTNQLADLQVDSSERAEFSICTVAWKAFNASCKGERKGQLCGLAAKLV